MTSQDIKRKLYRYYENSDYKLFNTFVFDFESDFFCMTKSGHVIECEIKISRSDFFADFKKTSFRRTSFEIKTKHEILQDKSIIFKPNRFYFAVPDGLIKKDEVPEHAGLIYINDTSTIIKNAPLLHKDKLMNNIHFVRKLMNKYYYRCIDLRKELELRDCDLRHGQGRLDKRY